MSRLLKNITKMLISYARLYKKCIFVPTKHSSVFVYIALDSIHTNNNTPSLPLNNAHSEGFFF